jgi:hypothetical protein
MPFKTCTRCGKQVRLIDDRCWNCGFRFAAEGGENARPPATVHPSTGSRRQAAERVPAPAAVGTRQVAPRDRVVDLPEKRTPNPQPHGTPNAVNAGRAQAPIKVHAVNVDLCTARWVATTTRHKYPQTTTTTRYETHSLGAIAIAARPGAGSRFTFNVQADCRIEVKQSEYVVLRPEDLTAEPSPDLRRAFARAGRRKLLAESSLLLIGLSVLSLLVAISFTPGPVPRWPGAPRAALIAVSAVFLCAAGISYSAWQLRHRPVAYFSTGAAYRVRKGCAWLVNCELLGYSGLAQSRDHILIVESLRIAAPMRDYWFRYQTAWHTNDSWGTIPLHRSLVTAEFSPGSLTSIFGQLVATFSSTGLEVYRSDRSAWEMSIPV